METEADRLSIMKAKMSEGQAGSQERRTGSLAGSYVMGEGTVSPAALYSEGEGLGFGNSKMPAKKGICIFGVTLPM